MNLVVGAGMQFDEHIIESFFAEPDRALPETEPFTFMNLAQDASRAIRERGSSSDST